MLQQLSKYYCLDSPLKVCLNIFPLFRVQEGTFREGEITGVRKSAMNMWNEMNAGKTSLCSHTCIDREFTPTKTE